MRGERRLLSMGELLVSWAAHRLPAEVRDERRRETAGKNTRRLGVLVAAFTVMAALLALVAFMVYQTIVGVSLAYYGAGMLTSLAALVACFLSPRTPGRAFRLWISAGAVTLATGRLVSALAGHLGWGPPLLFTLIGNCGWVVCVACDGVAGIIVIRSARRARWPDPWPLR